MADPRALNCRAYSQDASGLVTGIELGITTIANSKYEVYAVNLIDEKSAGGQTIATCQVLDKNGINTGEQVRLTWAGKQPPFADSGISGSGNNVHVISNGFSPPSVGPLALHTGGFNTPTSDIVWGLGLPFRHHVSFHVIFREKGAIVTPPIDNSDLTNRVAALEQKTTATNTALLNVTTRVANTEKANATQDATIAAMNARLLKLETGQGGAGNYPLPTHRMGVHWIPVGVQEHKDYIKRLKPSVIKVVNGNKQDLEYCLANLDTNGLLVVRDHARSEQQDFLARDPVACGKQHALEWKNDFSATGKYAGIPKDRILVCALNEPFVRGVEEEKKVLQYTIALLTDLKAYGLRCLCMNLSVGWVRDGGVANSPPVWDTFLPLEQVIRDGNHVLGLHEYWYNDPDEAWAEINGIKFGWRAFRHLYCPMQVPIIIGECGLTKAVDYVRWINDGKPPKGWIGNKTPAQYAEQLWRYAQKCSPNVIAVLPFTTGYASQDWAEDATDTAHNDIVARKVTYQFPANFPIKPNAPSVPSNTKLFVFPKHTGLVTGFYGTVYKNLLGTYAHEGLDVSAVVGRPLYAPYDGVVAMVAEEPTTYGKYIRIYHKALGVHTFFAHLSDQRVATNQNVKQGDLIGYTGNTGNSTGPHLHFEIRFGYKDSFNASTYRPNVSAHSNARVDALGFMAGWIAAGNIIEER